MCLLSTSKTMIAGVCRAKGRGMPTCIEQHEETRKQDKMKKRGTLKVAVLENDPLCKDFIACSLYDTKPFYFFSSSCTEIKWSKKEREVWHAQEQKKIKLPFYRLSMIDDYNKNMNNVDIADQLRTVYRYNRWMQKQKWWWSIAFWALQMLQTNAYIIYCKYHKMHLSEPMSHYNFIESIALSWLDKEQYGPKKKQKGKRNLRPKPPSCRRLYNSSSSSVTTRSTTFSTEDTSTSKSIRVNDATLHPINGALKMRLDHTNFHFPLQNKKKYAGCQLHKWACNEITKYKRDLCYCSECKVTLCLECNKDFHSITNIVDKKEKIRKRILKNQEKLKKNNDN